MNKEFLYTFTVFTPTYNRAHLLPRLFESLRSQSFIDFEWIIIDDGSEDETSETVQAFNSIGSFPILYQYQPHQHKKVAHNLAIKLARGKLFLPVDSDDELLPTALEILSQNWNEIPEDQQALYAGVTGLRIDESNKIIGTKFPLNKMDSTSLDMFYCYKIKGDKCGFIRTDILLEFPFPENIPNHVPEGVVFSKIARFYKTRYINEPLLKAYKNANQITNYKYQLRLLQENADGHAYWAREILTNELDYFRQRPFWFFKIAANYTRFHLHMKMKGSLNKYPIQSKQAKGLVLAMLPIATIRFLLDYRRKN